MSFRKSSNFSQPTESTNTGFTYSSIDSSTKKDSWRQRSSFSFSSNYEPITFNTDNLSKSYFTYSQTPTISSAISNGLSNLKEQSLIKKKPLLLATRGTKSMEDNTDAGFTSRFTTSYCPVQNIASFKSFSQLDSNDASKITDNLYLSGLKAVTLDKLRHFGITMIVSVLREGCPIRASGIESVELSIDDQETTDISIHFPCILARIHDHIAEDGRVLVHCIAGISRSATIVIAYLIRYHGYSLVDAYNFVKTRRCCVQPNAGFWQQLAKFETQMSNNESSSVNKSNKFTNGSNGY